MSCRYFNFDINPTTGKSHVIIDLSGDGLDTTMKLRASDLNNTIAGPVIRENDDNPEQRNSQDSRVGVNLGPGYYVVEALLKDPSRKSSSKKLTLTVKSEDIIYHPSGDHQEDRTVGYSIGQMPADPEVHPIPPDHPSQLMPRVVNKSLNIWNRVGGSEWPYLKFCTTPCSENSDGHFIEIKAGLSNECGDKVGCARLKSVITSKGHRHMTTGTVWLEQPATDVHKSGKTHTLIWTEDSAKHGRPVDIRDPMPDEYWWLLMPVALHELGHTLGMDDLYEDTTRSYSGYLMDKPGKLQNIPAGDINYMKQIYRQYPD